MKHKDVADTPKRRSNATRDYIADRKNGREHRTLPPNLRDIERTVFVILTHGDRDVWHLVDEFRDPDRKITSPVRQQLWRRGFEVRQKAWEIDPEVVQVWARWTHPLPTTVAPWAPEA